VIALYGEGPGTAGWTRNIVYNYRDFQSHWRLDYRKRLVSVLGNAYVLVNMVAESTPEDASLLIPEGPEYDPLSNLTWAAYYLHPRRLYRPGDLKTPFPADVDYLLIYKGWGLELIGVPADSITGKEWGLYDLSRLRRKPAAGGGR
jgi:hypothetical protein